jgi:hypothetical protein
MSFFKRLKAVFDSEEQRDRHDALAEVRRFYTGAMQRQRELERQSALAPHAAGRDGLLALAQEESAVADQFRRLIQGLGSFAGDVPKAPEPIGALNYWARLTQMLEAHRHAVAEMLDEATLLTDGQPELADELRRIAREEMAHGAKLRALIAKSDPQAID